VKLEQILNNGQTKIK